MENIIFSEHWATTCMGHSTELVQTAVPNPKTKTFEKHLIIKILDAY